MDRTEGRNLCHVCMYAHAVTRHLGCPHAILQSLTCRLGHRNRWVLHAQLPHQCTCESAEYLLQRCVGTILLPPPQAMCLLCVMCMQLPKRAWMSASRTGAARRRTSISVLTHSSNRSCLTRAQASLVGTAYMAPLSASALRAGLVSGTLLVLGLR